MKDPRIIWPDRSAVLSDVGTEYGRKALGLLRIPESWCPPFFVLSSACFTSWRSATTSDRPKQLDALADSVLESATRFGQEWSAGIILRSSAVKETLSDRGAYQSRALPADYGIREIRNAIDEIYNDFDSTRAESALAIIVQPIVPGPNRFLGHLSNERRVSKTVNHWMFEIQGAVTSGRFNSQRAQPANAAQPLVVTGPGNLLPIFRSVGRWSTQLGKGPAHIEWALSNERLWLLQLDFEDESPDTGVNPRALIRATDSAIISPSNFDPLRILDASNYTT